jgi:hypothetical protein
MFGGIVDLSKWFRQLCVSPREYHKQCLNWRGKYYLDLRMQMGKVSAANVAQRLTYVLVAACERRLDVEIAEFVRTMEGAEWDVLRAWQAERLVTFNGDTAQARLYFMDSFQDDIHNVALTEEIKELVERRVPEIIKMFLGEGGVSTKTPPFSSIFVSIGAEYDLVNMRVRPRPEKRALYLDGATWVSENVGRLATTDQLAKFMGLHEFILRFVDDRGAGNSGFRCLRTPIMTEHRLSMISRDFAADVKRVADEICDGDGMPLVKDPVVCLPTEPRRARRCIDVERVGRRG